MEFTSIEFWIQRTIATLLIILIGFIVYGLFSRAVRLVGRKDKFARHRVSAIIKLAKFSIRVVCFLLIVAAWGFSVQNIWIVLSGVVGLVAIGFFAVWSILSNIVAGVLLFFLNPFQIGDNIVVIGGDDIQGVVDDIELMFVNLRIDGGTVRVPNNIFFQRAIRIKRPDADTSPSI